MSPARHSTRNLRPVASASDGSSIIRQRYALLIGVRDYVDDSFRPLPHTINDVTQLARVLMERGYTVRCLHSEQTDDLLRPTRDNIWGELENMAQQTGPGDLLLVHFGGHGELSGEKAYLLPETARRASLRRTAIDLDELKEVLFAAKAQARILFLDACHSGIGRSSTGMDPDFERSVHLEATGSATLAACRSGQVAYEHDSTPHGAFTYYLLEGLRGAAAREGRAYVTFDGLKDYVYANVKAWAVGQGKQQRPNASTELEGNPQLIELMEATVAPVPTMRDERSVDQLFRLAMDRDAEAAATAVQSLLQMGQAVRERALALAQQPEADMHQAGLAYLSALLGQPMVYVPPGSFLMGSDPAVDESAYDHEQPPGGRPVPGWAQRLVVDESAYDREQPQHAVPLPGYWIGRYPVTVAQVRAFVQASGYKPADKDSLQGQDDHPVTWVTWHDALAYCRWLGERSGLTISLPSEAQWEKAARGTDGRIYPWGDQPPTDKLCNFGDNVGETTAVGRYSPAGDSPYGCADMAGNVWEWTRSLLMDYPYDPQDSRREEVSAGGDRIRVLRGGSFDRGVGSLRCAFRSWNLPDFLRLLGFRVVLSPIRSGL